MFVTIVKLPSNETKTTKSDTVKFQDAESKVNKQNPLLINSAHKKFAVSNWP